MIYVISSKNLYGLWGSFILNNLTTEEYRFEFTNKVNPNNIDFRDNDMGIILLGIPLQENQVKSFQSNISNLTDIPFVTAQHYANWGEGLNNLDSYIDTERNFTQLLHETINNGEEIIKYRDKESATLGKQITDALQSHHEYDGKKMGKDLMLLADYYGERLVDKNYKNFNDLYSKERETLAILNTQMKSYIDKKISQADIQELADRTAVVSLHAERYVNELGRVFINSLTNSYDKVIVMVGKNTKGDDMYHIRTSEGVSATEVAQDLNNGGGKERAATVFLPKGNQYVYNTIITTLNRSLSEKSN